MVGKYNRTTTRQHWSSESMNRAIQAVEDNQMGWLKASKMFSFSQATLRRWCKNVIQRIICETKPHHKMSYNQETSDGEFSDMEQDLYPEVVVLNDSDSSSQEDFSGRLQEQMELKPFRPANFDDIPFIDEESARRSALLEPNEQAGRLNQAQVNLQNVIPNQTITASELPTEQVLPLTEGDQLPEETPMKTRMIRMASRLYAKLIANYRTVSGTAFHAAVGLTLAIFLTGFDDFQAPARNEGVQYERNKDKSHSEDIYQLDMIDYPATTEMLIAAAVGAFLCGFRIEQMGMVLVLKSASVFIVFALTLLMYIGGTASRILGCIFTGFSLGFAIPAAILWTVQTTYQEMWGMIIYLTLFFTALGMLAPFLTILAYCLLWIIMLCNIVLLKDTKSVTPIGAFFRRGQSANVNEDPEAQPIMVPNRVNRMAGSGSTVTSRGTSGSPQQGNIIDMYLPVLNIFIISVLQHVSGVAAVLMVATDFYAAYECTINVWTYSKAMVIICVALTFAVFVFMCFYEKIRLFCVLSHIAMSVALTFVALFCILITFFPNGLDMFKCTPGILTTVAALMGLAGSPLGAVLCCAKLVVITIRPRAMGITVGSACFALLVILHAYEPLLELTGRAAVASLLAGTNIAATIVICAFLPEM